MPQAMAWHGFMDSTAAAAHFDWPLGHTRRTKQYKQNKATDRSLAATKNSPSPETEIAATLLQVRKSGREGKDGVLRNDGGNRAVSDSGTSVLIANISGFSGED